MRDLKVVKKKMRVAAASVRADAFARHGSAASARLAEHGLGFLGDWQGATVSAFSAIGDEINPLPLMLRLASKGHPLALPCIQGKGTPLIFRAWTPGDEMVQARWGIAEPLPSRAEVVPDIVLVPLLAYDVAGYRLGYGGGFYDRTLTLLRAMKLIVAVGLAYDEQRLDGVPHLNYDQPLDWVLTPSGAMTCARS